MLAFSSMLVLLPHAQGQPDGEGASPSHLALHLDGASVSLNQRLADCQAKADPLGPGAEERLKEPRQDLCL